MNICKLVDEDLYRCAAYWAERQQEFLPDLYEDFQDLVKPDSICYEPVAGSAFDIANLAMAEWFLFDRGFGAYQSALDAYLAHPPRGVSFAHKERLTQISHTQFFSQFVILNKDAASGMCLLEDRFGGRRYQVFDSHVAEHPRWGTGLISERIARCDGQWMLVGRIHLYDTAPAKLSIEHESQCDTFAACGSGGTCDENGAKQGVHEHAQNPDNFFIQLLRDCLSMDGRYHASMRISCAP
ncbi:hypothetical protein KPC83_03185 [Collinsella sp. zg1085]|uniref:hypothetical protein n=1 Tax=Collinsella sp. zg1085 TaxID=2844380 RepID=UPI001C0ABB5D|nr:hypothetical protein [Collinsella sp. zg1085]QWT18146.1 hypothetical protein KPC83_03185 [Collinsella sp. zg1085]